MHLVKITAMSPSEPRPFPEVRERLAEAWRLHQQGLAQMQLARTLMRKHRVVVDPDVLPWLGPFSGWVEVRP